MKLSTILTAAAILALPLTANAATFVIPAAGNANGFNGSVWQSDVTFHSNSPAAINVTLRYRDGSYTAPKSVTIAPRATMTLENIVKTTFEKTASTGAIEIDVPDADARRVAITSRTYNLTSSGEFGQDIPVTRIDDSAAQGDIVVIPGPVSAAKARFNFGIYTLAPTVVRWDLVRKNGTVAATKTEVQIDGVQRQFGTGLQGFFGVASEDNDTVRATMMGGRAVFFGSMVDQATGDPTYVPPTRTRDTIQINFLGADLDENGTVDIADADRDGVLDAPIEITTSMYPNYFRLLAIGEFGEAVTFELISAPADSALLTTDGTMQAAGPGDLKGKNLEILVRATAAGTSTTLRIPVHYR